MSFAKMAALKNLGWSRRVGLEAVDRRSTGGGARAWWIAAVLLAACSDTERPPPGSCFTNRDCREDEQCISGKCQGSEVQGCLNNQDCKSDELCVGGTCKKGTAVGCGKDEDCPNGNYCDVSSSTCRPVESTTCTGDQDCPAHQRCDRSAAVCVDGARNPDACANDNDCSTQKPHCDPSDNLCKVCFEKAHCVGTRECLEGECRIPPKLCVDDLECGPNKMCDPTTKVCVDRPPGCADDSECQAPISVCEARACVPGCGRPSSPVACGAGTQCDELLGRCVPAPTTCSMDAECGPPAKICEGQSCVASCTNPQGGLVCTGGNICDGATGRCRPPGGSCVDDTGCVPPASVCEQNQCVPGCSQPSGLECVQGRSVCDTRTGRCLELMTGCTMDGECNPPNTVCESTQCVPGCGAPLGGLNCVGQSACNAGTGRCDPVAGGCANDASCGPPARVCDINSGTCVSGCSVTGCTGTDECNTTSGRCGPPVVVGTGGLGDFCAIDGDCQSKLCFDYAGLVAGRCVQSCGSSDECPAGSSCYNFYGAKVCTPSDLVIDATFAKPSGSSCLDSLECQSNVCYDSFCAETCADDSDCGGITCQVTRVSTLDYETTCLGDVGLFSYGRGCALGGLPLNSLCKSGMCLAGANTCTKACSSTADCTSGDVCQLYIANQISEDIVKVCAPANHGASAIGASCSGPASCRSSYCIAGTCTDLCARDADCGRGFKCGVIQWGTTPTFGSPVFANVCVAE